MYVQRQSNDPSVDIRSKSSLRRSFLVTHKRQIYFKTTRSLDDNFLKEPSTFHSKRTCCKRQIFTAKRHNYFVTTGTTRSPSYDKKPKKATTYPRNTKTKTFHQDQKTAISYHKQPRKRHKKDFLTVLKDD